MSEFRALFQDLKDSIDSSKINLSPKMNFDQYQFLSEYQAPFSKWEFIAIEL
jgi:hypothetical protein